MQESVYEKLRNYRIKNKMTQQQVADRLDVSRQAVTKWEAGESFPSTANLISLSRLYHVSIEELTGEKEMEAADERDNADQEQKKSKTFWTIEKQAFFVFLIGAFFVAAYILSPLFDLHPSMISLMIPQILLFTVTTVITFITDERSRTKGGFFDIFSPLLFVIGVQIIIGLIYEL